MITQKDIKTENFTPYGEMNLILQIWGNINNPEDVFTVDQYQPRKNKVWNGEIGKEELVSNVKDTIERLKIGQQLLQDWLDGKRDDVYYYDLDELNS